MAKSQTNLTASSIGRADLVRLLHDIRPARAGEETVHPTRSCGRTAPRAIETPPGQLEALVHQRLLAALDAAALRAERLAEAAQRSARLVSCWMPKAAAADRPRFAV